VFRRRSSVFMPPGSGRRETRAAARVSGIQGLVKEMSEGGFG